MYKHFFKPLFDFILSCLGIIILSPFFLIFTPIVAIAMRGNPFFVQKRPGKNGKIFKLIKYRTMTNAKDKDGNLLPDEKRMTGFGKKLRSLSIDELPELFNILLGQMSIVGPRPQLVKDMVFFDDSVILRQSVRPGLTGSAQVNGRNNILWEERFAFDIEYVNSVKFATDIKIIFKTVGKVLKSEDIATEGMETSEDYGDYLLRKGDITENEYNEKVGFSKEIISNKKSRKEYYKTIVLKIKNIKSAQKSNDNEIKKTEVTTISENNNE